MMGGKLDYYPANKNSILYLHGQVSPSSTDVGVCLWLALDDKVWVEMKVCQVQA